MGLRGVASEKHTGQRRENLRNSLGLNYKSAALPAELCPHYSRLNGSASLISHLETTYYEIEQRSTF